jgi:hypothetical protein
MLNIFVDYIFLFDPKNALSIVFIFLLFDIPINKLIISSITIGEFDYSY